MVRLGYNANGWRRFPLQTATAELAALGYDGIELWCHPCHLDVQRAGASELADVRATIEASGLTLSNLHAGVKDALDDGYEPTLMAGSERRVAFVCAAIDAAVALGTRLVTINTGFAPPDVTPAAAREAFLRTLGACLDHADERGVRLLVEPEPGMYVETVRDFLELVGHPALGLNLDVGHAQWGYEDAPAIIRELAEHVAHVHVEDIAGRVHRHLPPGEGEVDFGAIWAALDAVDYDGFASVELFDHADDPASAARTAIALLDA